VSGIATSALVVSRVVDAASGQPRPVGRVSAQSPHAAAHLAAGGYLVVTGRPELAVPDLATTARELRARVELDDAPDVELIFALPAGTALPLRAPDVAVELPPVALTGTVSEAKSPYGPVPGAVLAVTHAEPGRVLVGLRTPLAAEYPDGATARARTLAVNGPLVSLTAGADGGSTEVVLDDVTGCSDPDAVLVLGAAPTAEHVAVASVDVPAKRVTLTVPLRRTRAAGAPAQAHRLTGAGAPTTLVRPALPGDGVVALAADPAAAVLEVGGPAAELRAAGAVADGDGRWRLDGVRAIGRLTIAASAPGFLTTTVVHDVDQGRPNVLDLDLTT
jgi:hypothetical protein